LDLGQELARRGVDGFQVTAGRTGDPVAVTGAGIYRLDVQFIQDFGDLTLGGEHASILAPGFGLRARLPGHAMTAALTPSLGSPGLRSGVY